MAMVGDPNQRSNRASAALERDAALGRIVRTRRWLLAGAAALTAALAALASALLPGKSLGAKVHSKSATSQPVARRSNSSTPRLPPPAGAAALGLRSGDSGTDNSGAGNSGAQAAQPQPAPQPAPAPAPTPSGNSGGGGGGVVSGGS
jgi:hypothetical protein